MNLIISDCSSVEDRLAWERFVLNQEGSTGYHLYSWRNVINEVFGHETIYLMGKNESGEVFGVAPLVILSSQLFGRFLISLPFLNYGGILTTNLEVRVSLEAYLEDLAASKQVDYVELRQQNVVATSWVRSERKVSMRLPIPASYEELVKGFPSKLRSQVRRAQKEGMTSRVGGTECLDEFYTVFSRCMRDLGTPVYAKGFFAKILEVFP
ncbi:MAG TPA: hypothetical protein PKH05_16195, partial [Nitrospira sp.]|nr:hypothetical protein [Nitrospira sp.]